MFLLIIDGRGVKTMMDYDLFKN